MIIIKNKMAISRMRTAGKKLAEIMDIMKRAVKPYISTLDLDQLIASEMSKRGLISSSKGYKGFDHYSCISLNDVVVHGIPSKDRIIKDGDIVKVDICASWKGYCADMARSFLAGSLFLVNRKRLIDVAASSFGKGFDKVQVGNYLSDISSSIQLEVENNGFGVVRAFTGHGIGKTLHEDPGIPNFGKPGSGPILRHGMTLAIEPMITEGGYEVYVADDGWTVLTVDGKLAAHYENTVLVTDNGPEILTR